MKHSQLAEGEPLMDFMQRSPALIRRAEAADIDGAITQILGGVQ